MEECIQAGIKKFIFVVPKNRPSIKKYFFNDKFYKNIIKKKKMINVSKKFLEKLSVIKK